MEEVQVVIEEVSSPQSAGGKARKEKLSPEQRKEIASKAATDRWAKKKASKAAPEPEPPKPAKRKLRPMPQQFKGASGYAEKRLAAAIKERAEAMGRVAALNAEIPSLVTVINALKSTQSLPMVQMQDFMMPSYTQPTQMPYAQPQFTPMPQVQPDVVRMPQMPTSPIPGAPVASGGAMGLDFVENDDPDQFLKGEGAGGRWI